MSSFHIHRSTHCASPLATRRRHAGRFLRLVALAALLLPGREVLAQQSTVRLDGIVVDSASGAPISGATVRIVELNRDERTHGDGTFEFHRVPAGRYTLIARRPGHRMGGVTVDVRAGSPPPRIRITLAPATVTLSAVVVTGAVSERSRDDVLSPTSVLANGALDRALDGSLATTVEQQAGVAVTSVGPATAKPVVRGLSGDRVLVLEDGQRPGDMSATSGDHAIAIEAITARQVEVVRGPMSLLYGSSALGGVVNVVRDEVPTTLPEHPHGTLLTQAGSANSGLAVAGSGVTALGSLALRAEASVRDASDLRTPLGRLENTGLRSYGASTGAAWVLEDGHVGGAYRFYDSRYGIPGGFVGSHPEGVDVRVRRHALRGEGVWRPHARVRELRATVQLSDFMQEELEKSGEIGTAFVQRIASGEVIAQTGGVGPFNSGAIGVRGQVREVLLGGVTRTPDTDDQSFAAFVVQEYATGPWRLQGGLRYDHARFDPRGEVHIHVGDEEIESRPRTFGALSGSLGAIVELRDGIRLGANVSRAFRTPDYNELYSDGPHLAAYSYDVGNPSLEEETGVGVDVFLRVTRPSWRGEIAAFRNDLRNYVFPRNTGAVARQGNRPLFQYVGRDAVLQGVEGDLHLELAPRWSLEATASYVRGTLESRGDFVPASDDPGTLVPASRDLPLMPPLNGQVTVRYEGERWFGGVGTRMAARQERIGDFETPTAGYALLDLQAGVKVPVGAGMHSITLRLDNVLDQEYRSHLSRTKSVIPEVGFNAQLLYRWTF